MVLHTAHHGGARAATRIDMDRILHPRSVAVFGASEDIGKFGGRIISFLLRHGFGDLTPQARTAFATGTTPAQVFAARIDREALVAEAGLDWRISPTTALGLTYSAAIGERSRDHALKGRVEMRF